MFILRRKGGRIPSGILLDRNPKITISLSPSGCLLLGLGKYPPCPYSAGGKLGGVSCGIHNPPPTAQPCLSSGRQFGTIYSVMRNSSLHIFSLLPGNVVFDGCRATRH